MAESGLPPKEECCIHSLGYTIARFSRLDMHKPCMLEGNFRDDIPKPFQGPFVDRGGNVATTLFRKEIVETIRDPYRVTNVIK